MTTQMDSLKAQLRAIRDTLDSAQATRLHRAISWYQCAEQYQDDHDVGFITLWIAFNACYGVDAGDEEYLGDRASFKRFVQQLVELDTDNAIYNCMWMNFSKFIKALIDNHYVFYPFWRSYRNGDNQWETSFKLSRSKALGALSANDTTLLLEITLDRLYVLRNQLIHGGATYQSQVNREQVRNGRLFLKALLPSIVQIMMDNADKNWGEIAFPVVPES